MSRLTSFTLVVLAAVAGISYGFLASRAPEGEVAFAQFYADNTVGFSIRLPEGYVADPTYHYEGLGPDATILGTRFTIPSSFATGTNLASDTYLSVEGLPGEGDCVASRFLEASSTSIVDGDVAYSFATSTDATAGNRYEETVYALPGTDPCLAVRYFVHYGVFENYPTGSVTAFDRAALLHQFDQIRHTLIVAP